jgi:hypothetical protein
LAGQLSEHPFHQTLGHCATPSSQRLTARKFSGCCVGQHQPMQVAPRSVPISLAGPTARRDPGGSTGSPAGISTSDKPAVNHVAHWHPQTPRPHGSMLHDCTVCCRPDSVLVGTGRDKFSSPPEPAGRVYTQLPSRHHTIMITLGTPSRGSRRLMCFCNATLGRLPDRGTRGQRGTSPQPRTEAAESWLINGGPMPNYSSQPIIGREAHSQCL